jgi:hypothetical protein
MLRSCSMTFFHVLKRVSRSRPRRNRRHIILEVPEPYHTAALISAPILMCNMWRFKKKQELKHEKWSGSGKNYMAQKTTVKIDTAPTTILRNCTPKCCWEMSEKSIFKILSVVKKNIRFTLMSLIDKFYGNMLWKEILQSEILRNFVFSQTFVTCVSHFSYIS